MTISRRSFLAAQGALVGAAFLPGQLLAAVEASTPAMPPLGDWTRVRRQFRLSPEWLHFAGFYIASHPAPVRDAIEGFRRAIDDNPFLVVERGLFEGEAANLQRRVRVEVASYLGGRAEDVALTQNTTTGLSLVYHGLSLRPGDEILTTVHDHIAHHEAIRLSTERNGASVRKISLFDQSAIATRDGIVGRIRDAIRPATRVVGITWVHSATGIRLPIRDIAAALREVNRSRDPAARALLVVDGVHGIGAVDETIAQMGADFFCAGTHKWMFAPRGTGIVWAPAENWSRLHQLLPTFSDKETFLAWTEARPPHPPVDAQRFTPGGFQAYEHQWGMSAAFRMHRELGRARVAERVRSLNGRLKQGLAENRKVTLHTPRDPDLSAGICCFEVAGRKPEEVVASLLAKKVVASTSPYAVSYARLSAGIFNTPEEVARALTAVRSAAAA